MNKLVLSLISFISIITILSSCNPADNTAPQPPMTASFTLPSKSATPFTGSYVTAVAQTNNPSPYRNLDSTVAITGHIYKPGTTQDSALIISILIQRYHTGIGSIAIDHDTFAYAAITDQNGTTHYNALGAIFFNAATAYGTTGTFSFKCDDNTNVTNGWFIASWRENH